MIEGRAMAEESKESTLTIRVTPLVKAKAMRRALQEGMSLANYIGRPVETTAINGHFSKFQIDLTQS